MELFRSFVEVFELVAERSLGIDLLQFTNGNDVSNNHYALEAKKTRPNLSVANFFMPKGDASSYVNVAGVALLDGDPVADGGEPDQEREQGDVPVLGATRASGEVDVLGQARADRCHEVHVIPLRWAVPRWDRRCEQRRAATGPTASTRLLPKTA